MLVGSYFMRKHQVWFWFLWNLNKPLVLVQGFKKNLIKPFCSVMDLFSHISRLMVPGSSKKKKKLLGGHGSIHLRIAQNVFFSSYYHCTTNKMWPSTSTTCLNPTKSSLRRVSFRLIFCDKKKKGRCERYKGFFIGKNWPKLPHYEGEKKSKVIIFK